MSRRTKESDMFTNTVTVKIVDDYKDAPKYSDDTTMLKMKECIIVGKGTEAGNPSVDIQLTDKDGNKFLIMATGGIIEMIAGAIVGKKERDNVKAG